MLGNQIITIEITVKVTRQNIFTLRKTLQPRVNIAEHFFTNTRTVWSSRARQININNYNITMEGE